MNRLLGVIAAGLIFTIPQLAQADRGGHWESRGGRDRYYSSYNVRNQNHSNGFGWGSGNRWHENRGHYHRKHPRNSRFDGDLSHGVRTGQLSRAEVAELRDKREQLARQEWRYRRDGYLSRSEREDLRDDYQDYQRDLRHELNDGERRYR